MKSKYENSEAATCCGFDLEAAKQLKIAVADMSVTVVSGMEGLCLAAAAQEADLVLNSVVGMVGLRPTLAAIDAKKDVALANKGNFGCWRRFGNAGGKRKRGTHDSGRQRTFSRISMLIWLYRP